MITARYEVEDASGSRLSMDASTVDMDVSFAIDGEACRLTATQTIAVVKWLNWWMEPFSEEEGR